MRLKCLLCSLMSIWIYFVTMLFVFDDNLGNKIKRFYINIPKDQVDYVSPDFPKQDFKTCKSSVFIILKTFANHPLCFL
jgi:hypothetical protein